MEKINKISSIGQERIANHGELYGNYSLHYLFCGYGAWIEQERIKDEDENPHVEKDVFDVKKIYWDNDGNLRHGKLRKC